ncbi:type IV pilin protein [Echinimonas agarilytica]|uniref:Prepilin-type N-terminal cleavage/methylation domain-containing protein n=1 Tax=Echinimonas agarilytica TaxID=1215918 RepID=A0AA41W853_9GAMM|nr:type IV pilin protein [Echinimonas agarilytica]MCM2680611.1 prepilin-type N-terminal cleavage/methylation domain-containing protein [Echinimonas agarilytica]
MIIGKRSIRGFSLIELMIAVLILGVLVLVAYPSYTDHVMSTKRQKAMADLLALANAMETYKAQSYSYGGAGANGADTGAPTIFNSWSPADEPSANKAYNLTIKKIGDNGRTYELLATPLSTENMSKDGKLLYRSDGAKAWDSNNDGTFASSEYCWQC